MTHAPKGPTLLAWPTSAKDATTIASLAKNTVSACLATQLLTSECWTIHQIAVSAKMHTTIILRKLALSALLIAQTAPLRTSARPAMQAMA